MKAGSGVPPLHVAALTLGLAFDAAATNHILRQDEAMAGLNGDGGVQFVEITVGGGDQKIWGPQSPGGPSRAMLVFFNGAGVEVGRFFFPANAPPGGNTVLIATTNFAALPGAPVPDFIMPPLMSPGSGKVCFRGNPANPGAFGVNLCLSYGNFPADQTEGAGPPAPALPITGDPISLTRFQNFGAGQGTSQNADFALASPTPLNTRGQSMIFPVDGPEIHTIPTALNFGSRNIDQGPTGPLSLIITNRGVLNPLLITNVALAGANTNQFSILSDSGETNLPPGGTRTLTLNFDPSTPGLKTASVRIICNDTNEVITNVPVQGNGFDPNAPEIDVTPLTVNFGNHDVAAGPTPARNITILNQGQIGSLIISNISLSGRDASQFRLTTPTNGSTLGPNGTRTATVTFDPSSAGPKAAVLRIISADTDEGVTDVALEGRAFDLNPCTAPNPSNSVPQNVCVNAQLVCPGTIFTGTLSGTTPDGTSSCGIGVPSLPDAWCRYVPGSDGTLTATLALRGGVQVISAHSGCPGAPGNELACVVTVQLVITNPAGTQITKITIPVTNGVPVLLRLAGQAELNTPFQLVLEGPECVDFDQNKNGVTDNCEADFGDAPAPYPTTVAANGARHRAFTGVFLGQLIDPDDNGAPTPFATGDNLDGDINDEDGVVMTSALVVGQAANVEVTASTAGFLSAWIDLNVDGDWADAGEQVFTNRALLPGVNALTVDVPANATATNLTFARYRFSSRTIPGFAGPATDGEVEDYAVEILSATQTPGDFGVRINEVMAGLNGDSTVQFVELEVTTPSTRLWGPQGSETVGRAMLLFFDGAGTRFGRFVFPSNAPAGASTVLVATRAFADRTGLQPDFIMPPEVVPLGGKVVFTGNGDNLHFDTRIGLSYGGTEYFGMTEGAGPANTNLLPIMHAKSLARVQDFPAGLNQNAAFQLGAPTPRNTRAQTTNLVAATRAEQGRTLFMRETFRGNGRTCATCHVPGRDQFALTPAAIDALPRSDPLFVFEDNVNTLRLTVRSQPSDLRGAIRGTTGTAMVLSGSGAAYLIVGGTNLSGTITDTNGNSGSFQSFTDGDLDGPTPSNGSARGLEDHTLLEHGRGLILENIDGFKALEVFRASPHLLNLALTAPFGLSGEFDSLDEFSDGAVVQHFPKSLARISGVDFRHPTAEELAAMSEFMFGISNPSTNVLNLDRLATTEAQKRGRAFFFGDEGRCSKCHSGPVLALSDGSLSGSVSNRNENFDTGVANQLINLVLGDNLPTEPAGLEPGESTREFNTPGLFGIRLTAPFFHDGSALTLADAVKFYDSTEFHDSPAGVDVGSLLAANKSNMVDDVVAFLESLVELPVDFTREVEFGIRCPGGPLPGPWMAWITNIGSTTITITNVVLNGPSTSEFQILSDTGETTLAAGQTRRFEIAFAPVTLGVKRATLEVTAVDTNLLGSFSFGIALTGADVDNIVTAAPLSFDFGMRDIDAPPSPIESIVVTNDGTIDLEVVIELAGANPADFTMVTETNDVPAHGTRVIQVAFAPRTQGSKSAVVRIRMASCSGTIIEVPLAGIATSTIDHFAWNSIGATQFVGTPFTVRITAVDRNGDTVQNFRGTVRLSSVAGGQTNAMVPGESSPFVDGVWNGSVTVQQAAPAVRLLARDNQGHTGLSDPFAAFLRDDLSITAVDTPDPVNAGQQLTYTLTVHNTGPADATGVVVSNQLSPGVIFVSGSAGQGTVVHVNGVVTASLGTLARAATVTVSINVEPNPPAAAVLVTNVATVSRNEPEFNLANNTATNTTRIDPFGLLSVTPLDNFNSIGFTGGPFTPAEQIYTLSNAGTATLNWQARASGCAAPPGLVAWWPLDGNAADNVGTNAGTLVNGSFFTNGFIGQAVAFDGNDDGVRIPASPALDVGLASGMTAEAWINPSSISFERPVVEWDGGTHLWISVFTAAGGGGGAGSVFANVADVNGPTSHHVVSPPNLVVANAWQHIALTYSKASGLATLYLNGAVVARTNIGSFTPITSTELLIGKRNGAPGFLGSIDDVGIYNRDLSDAEIQSLFVAGARGKCMTTSGCSSAPSLVAWWTLNGNASDSVGTNVGIPSGGAVFTNGFVGEALLFNGNSSLRIPASPALNVGAGPGLTMEGWINPATISRQQPIVEWVGPGDVGVQLWISVALPGGGPGDLFANVAESNLTNHKFVSPPNLVMSNVWQHVALTYDTNTGLATLYFNGTIAAQQNIGSFVAFTAVDAFIGRQTYEGLIDDVGIYKRALTQAEIQSIFMSGAAGKCVPTCSTIPGTVASWSLDGSAVDKIGGNVGTLLGGPVFTNGFVGQALFFDGNDDGVQIPASSALNVGIGPGLTMEAWINPSSVAQQRPVMEWGSPSGIGVQLWISVNGAGSIFVNIVEGNNPGGPFNFHQLNSAANLVQPNVWQHVALTYNTNTGGATVYLNGAVVAQQNIGSFPTLTSVDFFIGRRPPSSSFLGRIDEVAVYNRELTGAEIQSIFNAGAAGKCGTPAWLTISDFTGALAPGATANVTLSINTNAARLPAGNYSETVSFTNITHRRGSTERLVSLTVLPPAIDDLSLAVTDTPDPIADGGSLTYTITVHNAGPAVATGVMLTNQLSAGVTFTSGNASQGTVSNANGIVVASLGSLASGAAATITLIVEANLPAGTSFLTNIASVSRSGAESFLGNNTVTNTTRVEPFGVLAVTPAEDFNSRGFTGGPFTPTNWTYNLSNVGNASLSWQAHFSGCTALGGLVAWWPLDGNAADSVGTNSGTVLGGAQFTNGFVGQALSLDGNDDGVRIPRSPSLNVGLGSGLTMEAWINPTDVSVQRPVIEWGDASAIGVQIWISVLTFGGPGSIFVNVVEAPPIHHVLSTANLVQPNVWQHVALTYNTNTGLATIYFNGAIAQQQNIGKFSPLTSQEFWIGRRPPSSTFLGRIDDVGVYNRELTPAEIQSIFNAGANGKCATGSWLTLSGFAGTLAPGSMTNVTFAINTNANRLSIGNYRETVAFTNTTHRRGSTERVALLAVLNRAPTLSALSSIQILEDSGPQTVNLLGISAGGETQQLNVSAFSSNPSLIANPIAVNYVSPAANGTLTFAPLPNAHGTSLVSVVVRDNGGIENGALDSVTNSFLVTVTPVNDAPTVALVPDQTIAEFALLTISNIANDVDLPDDQLTFTLPGAPAGLIVDPATRVLTWQPNETQGPSNYVIRVEVSDSGVPALRATNVINVSVLEVNEAPSMIPIADRTVHQGVLVTVNSFATDPDLPANAFTYSLGPNPPSGATITPAGAFAWTATEQGTNQVSLIVTDNGVPALSDSTAFNIIVITRPRIEITRSGDTITLRWTAIPGTRYRLQAKPDLAADWSDLPGDVTATSESATKTDTLEPTANRFYQIIVLQ